MTKNKYKKNRTLRDAYYEDPKALEFLLKHPEFDDRFLCQSEVNSPGFNITEGRYTLHDVSDDRKQYGEIMVEAVSLMPPSDHKRLLEAYYMENLPVNEIQARFDLDTRNAVYQRLWRAKKAALRNMIRKQHVRVRGSTPLEARTFTWNNQSRVIYLVFDEISRANVWVRENGEVLPDYAQEMLLEGGGDAWDEYYYL